MDRYYVDNKEREALYVDRANNHYADNNDLIKFYLKREQGKTTRKALAELIAMTLGLRGHAIEAYVTMICQCNGECKSKFYLAKETIKFYNLNVIPQTIAQVIEDMTKRLIFLYKSRFKIKVNPKYLIPESAENARFLIIDLNPEENITPIEL